MKRSMKVAITTEDAVKIGKQSLERKPEDKPKEQKDK